MTGAIKRVTTNFKLGIPFFDAPNWGASFERNMNIIDAVLSTAGVVSGIIGPWENNTAYGVDDRVVDMTNNTVWQCAVAHTSGSGTFAQDRAANPTYWDPVNTSIVVREAFQPGADYFVGDFVYDNSEFLSGVVLSPFTGGANLRDNIANIGVIIDFGSFDFENRLITVEADILLKANLAGGNVFTGIQQISSGYSGGAIAGLTGGTTGGGLVQGQDSGHLVVGLKDNDGGDSFSIVSGNGNYMSDQVYDKLVAQFRADGQVILNGQIQINGTSEAIAIRSAGVGIGPAFIRFEDSVGADIAAVGLGSSDADLDIVAYNNGTINLNAGAGTINVLASITDISSSGTTAYNAATAGAQIGSNTSLLIHNTTDNNGAFSQIVLRQRNTSQTDIRLVATGGTTPAFAVTTDDVERMRVVGTSVLVGATAGWNNGDGGSERGINMTTNGGLITSNDSLPTANFRRRGTAGRLVNFYDDGTTSGGVDVSGATATFVGTSDETWKDFIGIYDPLKAIDLIRRDPVRDFHWREGCGGRSGGEYGVGWGAQTSYEINPEFASVGGWFNDDGPCEPDDPGAHYQPWGIALTARIPYLWATTGWLLDERDALVAKNQELETRLDDIEARLAALETA